MKNERLYRNQGSAWAFLFKIAILFILFCAMPLFALNGSLHDAIDKWSSDLDNQINIVLVMTLVGLCFAVMHWIRKYKRAE
jgi:cyanate permease